MREIVKVKITRNADDDKVGISVNGQKGVEKSDKEMIKYFEQKGYKVDAERTDYLKNRKGKLGKVVRVITQVNLVKETKDDKKS